MNGLPYTSVSVNSTLDPNPLVSITYFFQLSNRSDKNAPVREPVSREAEQPTKRSDHGSVDRTKGLTSTWDEDGQQTSSRRRKKQSSPVNAAENYCSTWPRSRIGLRKVSMEKETLSVAHLRHIVSCIFIAVAGRARDSGTFRGWTTETDTPVFFFPFPLAWSEEVPSSVSADD